jgi:hypothetical protein
MQQLRELEQRLANTPTGEEYDRLFAQRAALLRTAQQRALKPVTEKT